MTVLVASLEAVLFVADEPLDLPTLSRVLEVGHAEVEAALGALAERYAGDGHGLVLREVAGGWRLFTAEHATAAVERFVLDGRTSRLSQAALETLAAIAYKQPVARQEVADIRGVNPDGPLRTLLGRGLIEEVGRDDGPGQAILYGTTGAFLEKLGLRDLDELPPLGAFLEGAAAPDEPAPGDLREARRRIAAGEDLPATGSPRWSPTEDRPAEEARMVELTGALDAAARAASARLRAAIAATEPPPEDDPDGPGDLDAELEPGAGDVAAIDPGTSAGTTG